MPTQPAVATASSAMPTVVAPVKLLNQPHPGPEMMVAAFCQQFELSESIHNRLQENGYLKTCHVPSRHVTPEPTTRLPVRTSYPDTIGTHPATRGMSGPLRKNLCIHYALEHDPAAVGYRFLFGTTSDDTTCYIHAHFCLRYSTL